MKNKTPKTIADLKINWTFDSKLDNPLYISFNKDNKMKLFKELNPILSNFSLKNNPNVFHLFGTVIEATALHKESLAEYISYLNCLISDYFPEMAPFKLSRFERISDTEYIIHGK